MQGLPPPRLGILQGGLCPLPAWGPCGAGAGSDHLCALVPGQMLSPNRNPGTYPNWESNQQPFSLYDNAQLTEPHWPGPVWQVFLTSAVLVGISLRLRFPHPFVRCRRTPFHMFAGHLGLFCEVPAQVSGPIFYQIVFFLLTYKNSLYILDGPFSC